MKQYTEYEDSFVWDLFFNEIVFLLEDLRRTMFTRGLEEFNDRSIQYFSNIGGMLSDENKVLDTELVIIATAKWIAIRFNIQHDAPHTTNVARLITFIAPSLISQILRNQTDEKARKDKTCAEELQKFRENAISRYFVN